MNKPKQRKHTTFSYPIGDITEEMRAACDKFPLWPECPVIGTAIVVEEAGEAMQAALDYRFGRGDVKRLREELIQTTAMCCRMIGYIDKHYVTDGIGTGGGGND